jgi:predicted Ser/Thr protein kinase
MTCPRCDGPATTETLQQFGGVCAKCLLDFTAEKDAPAFPGLEIDKVVGEGGMGVVYRAVQKQLGRTVALKVLSPALASDPQFVERFTREAKALAQLSHPNIVAVYDFGVHEGVPFLIMEFVEGTPLRKLLAAKKLSSERALELVPQICDALAYAHGRGVVHRDVKPENILIDREGRVKIADFGLAKLAEPGQTRITRTQMVMGTPNYMAPEQIENPSTVDHRADIYSLGVVFYEMLTGELPLGRFKAPSQKAPVDSRLDPVVLRSLEKEPADRYQQAAEVKEDVTRVRTGTAPLPTPPPGEHPRLRITPAVYWTAVPGLICMMTGIMLALTGNFKAAAWTAFGGALCLLPSLGIFLASGQPGRKTVPVAPPPQSALAHACKVILILALLALFMAIFLPSPIGEIVMAVAGALFIATLVLSVFTIVWVLVSRGRLRGAGAAFGAIVVSLLALGGFTFFRKSAPVAAPSVIVTRPPRSIALHHLSQIWPQEAELPGGLTFQSQLQDLEAIRAAKLPEALMADVEEARYAVLKPGDAELFALKFKSSALYDLWTSKPELEVSATRWARRSHEDPVSLWIGRGSFALGSPVIEELGQIVYRRLQNPRPEPVDLVRLGQAWPEEVDLPAGLTFQRQHEAAAALQEAKLPAELLADVDEVRFAVIMPGEIELLAFRFKSPAKEQVWSSKYILEAGNDRWGRSYRDKQRVLVLVGKGKGAGVDANVERLSKDLVARLNDPRPLPSRKHYPTRRLLRMTGDYKIPTGWPTAKDLEGLTKERETEGSRALYEGGLKEAMLADVAVIRRCTFLEGAIELLGIEFKTELARVRWLATMGFTGSQEEGRSVFILSYTGATESDAVARAIEQVIKWKPPALDPVTDFRIDDAWPTDADRREGMSFAEAKEGDDAFRGSGLPAECKGDIVRIRSVRVMPGNVYLAGIEFKSEALRRHWEAVPPIKGVTFNLPHDVPAAGGRSLFVWSSDGSPKALATHEAVRNILHITCRTANNKKPDKK